MKKILEETNEKIFLPNNDTKSVQKESMLKRLQEEIEKQEVLEELARAIE